MKILAFIDQLFGVKQEEKTESSLPHVPTPGAGGYLSSFAISYDGEKNAGDFGPTLRYEIDHSSLRDKSWQLYIDSDICQIVFKRFTTWVIGSGLKLEAEPVKRIIEKEGNEFNTDFGKVTEDLFKLYAASCKCDYSEMNNLNALASKVFLGSIVGGDMLVILRVKNGNVSIQIIDGECVSNPLNLKHNGYNFITESGNVVKNGIEKDAKGKHIAYHIRKGLLEWERIEAYSSGRKMAYLVTGLKYKTGDDRGIPLITAVIETSKKLDRYKEATIGSAEEGAKIAFSIEHTPASTGESPLMQGIAKASGINKPMSGDNPVDQEGKKLNQMVVSTTGKQAINMPIGSKLVSHESKKELYFNDFFTINIQLVCATVGIPPEVALMKYDSNFSASRAALKDWEHTIGVSREDFTRQFYLPIYHLWLEIQILLNRIQAPGYLRSGNKGNIVVEAYQFARFSGANVPHIDPLKEVRAEREKLGKGSEHIPLTTVEAATEALNGGDSHTNMAQFARELEEAESLNIPKANEITNSSYQEEQNP